MSTSVLSSHIGFEGRERLHCRLSRADGVRAYGGGNDKRLRIMNCERRESIRGALHNRGAAFNKIQNVPITPSVMMHRCSEPVASCLNELEWMQSGPLLPPSIPRGHCFCLID